MFFQIDPYFQGLLIGLTLGGIPSSILVLYYIRRILKERSEEKLKLSEELYRPLRSCILRILEDLKTGDISIYGEAYRKIKEKAESELRLKKIFRKILNQLVFELGEAEKIERQLLVFISGVLVRWKETKTEEYDILDKSCREFGEGLEDVIKKIIFSALGKNLNLNFETLKQELAFFFGWKGYDKKIRSISSEYLKEKGFTELSLRNNVMENPLMAEILEDFVMKLKDNPLVKKFQEFMGESRELAKKIDRKLEKLAPGVRPLEERIGFV
jgi:hypothetical protein